MPNLGSGWKTIGWSCHRPSSGIRSRVTVIFVLISVPLRLCLALGIASYLVREALPQRLLRGALFLPSVTSTVAIAVVFSWLFATDYGIINAALAVVGIPKIYWLQNPQLALWVIIIVNTWKQLGYDIVIYIAGLQAIPQELYDAAAVDGGRKRHVFRRVTVPLVMSTTYFLLVISVIEAFQVFTVVDVMTRGGPAGGPTWWSICCIASASPCSTSASVRPSRFCCSSC